LAELTHLGRSKVNASLKALEAGGHIRRRYGSIEVTSAAGLRDFYLKASFARSIATASGGVVGAWA